MQGTEELLKHHAAVYAVDSARQQQRIKDRIDQCEAHPAFRRFVTSDEFFSSRLRLGAAYIVNVLHTLPSVDDRVALLKAAQRNLTKSGALLVDVPYYEHYYTGRMTAENAFGDGFIFRQGPEMFTFYRFTTVDELDSWAARAGFRFDHRIVDNHHWVRIYRHA